VQQLNDQPSWTQDLGTAFVNQQTDVMGEGAAFAAADPGDAMRAEGD
jgi:hypothetical protein